MLEIKILEEVNLCMLEYVYRRPIRNRNQSLFSMSEYNILSECLLVGMLEYIYMYRRSIRCGNPSLLACWSTSTQHQYTVEIPPCQHAGVHVHNAKTMWKSLLVSMLEYIYIMPIRCGNPSLLACWSTSIEGQYIVGITPCSHAEISGVPSCYALDHTQR